MPLIDGDDAKIIYATQPTTLFDLVEADEPNVRRLSWYIAERHAIGCEVDDIASGTFAHGRLRGGSQAIRVDDGWIFVVHDVAFPGSGRIYLHRFAKLDDQWKLVALSDPFYFEQLHIEFSAGLAPLGNKLVASYAVNDGCARLGIFDLDRVQKSLREDFLI
jgi:predicted GH43/DUF377 family glycosyl hydrolase